MVRNQVASLQQAIDSDITSVRMEIGDLQNTAGRNSSSLSVQLNSLDSGFNTELGAVTIESSY